MDFYANTIAELKGQLKVKQELQRKVVALNEQLLKSQNLYVNMLEAQKVLSAISDNNTNKTLDFITSMVNKTLTEIFPHDNYKIKLSKKLYGGSKPHINLELIEGDDSVLKLKNQTGTGVKQIISFMYVICLIEIRKGRRLLILDERLNGLHKQAKAVISEIIKIFTKGGFRFIFVEYSLNNLGKIYNVEKRHNESTLVAVDGDYNEMSVYMSDVDLDALDENYVDDSQGVAMP